VYCLLASPLAVVMRLTLPLMFDGEERSALSL
jgi:hypothetical protein